MVDDRTDGDPRDERLGARLLYLARLAHGGAATAADAGEPTVQHLDEQAGLAALAGLRVWRPRHALLSNVALGATLLAVAAPVHKPHVIFMLGDEVGWNNVRQLSI